jgi:hypothetical protein
MTAQNVLRGMVPFRYPGSVVAGRDLQLEKTIEVMLEKIKKNPPAFPPTPAYPKK